MTLKSTQETIGRFGRTALNKVLFSATAVLAVFLCLSLPVEGRGRDKTAQPRPKLILKPTVVASTYCSASNLRLTLKLTFTNSGSEPILLRKEGFFVSRYFVSSDLEALNKRRHELNVRGVPSSVMIIKHRLQDKVGLAESLVTHLETGASHVATIQLYVPYIYDATDPRANALRPGDHVLQLLVWTWLDTKPFAASLQKQWRTRGFLWTETLVSEPVLFTVSNTKTISGCSDE